MVQISCKLRMWYEGVYRIRSTTDAACRVFSKPPVSDSDRAECGGTGVLLPTQFVVFCYQTY